MNGRPAGFKRAVEQEATKVVTERLRPLAIQAAQLRRRIEKLEQWLGFDPKTGKRKRGRPRKMK